MIEHLLFCQFHMRMVSVKPNTLAELAGASDHAQLTVIGATQYPGQLVVKEYSADIIQVATQREETSPRLVRPDLDLVVVAARHEAAIISVYQSCACGFGGAHSGWVLWKSMPRTGPSCSSNRSMRVPMR
jgi:hypothetical protein